MKEQVKMLPKSLKGSIIETNSTTLSPFEQYYNELVLNVNQWIEVPTGLHTTQLRTYLIKEVSLEEGYQIEMRDEPKQVGSKYFFRIFCPYHRENDEQEEKNEEFLARVKAEHVYKELIKPSVNTVVKKETKVIEKKKNEPMEPKEYAPNLLERLIKAKNQRIFYSNLLSTPTFSGKADIQTKIQPFLDPLAEKRGYQVVWGEKTIQLEEEKEEIQNEVQIETTTNQEGSEVVCLDQTELPSDFRANEEGEEFLKEHLSILKEHLTELEKVVQSKKVTPYSVRKTLELVQNRVQLRDWLEQLRDLEQYCLDRLLNE